MNTEKEEEYFCLDCGITLSLDEEIEDKRCLQCSALLDKDKTIII